MEDDPKKLCTRIQMLATLVATATYAAGFNPPGGVWQDIGGAAGHLPGDPIMRSTHHLRYAVFFYCNAIAFTLSLIVVVVTLFATDYPKGGPRRMLSNVYLGVFMAAAMVAFTVAYGAGACRTKTTMVTYSILVPFPYFFVMLQAFLKSKSKEPSAQQDSQAFRRFSVMVRLSMFALTISYVAGLSTPGGFWDSTEGGHRPGDAILGDRLQGRILRSFLTFNTTAFLVSLCALSLLIVHPKKPQETVVRRFLGTAFQVSRLSALFYLLWGLLLAYMVGNSRGRVNWPLYGGIFACMVVFVSVYVIFNKKGAGDMVATILRQMLRCAAGPGNGDAGATTSAEDQRQPDPENPEINEEATPRQQRRNDDAATTTDKQKKDARRRRQASLVQLMAGLAVAITYQAGLYPPGGLWAANDADGHTAGDPILLTTSARRYKGFYYCNSVSFVASLLAMFLAQKKTCNEHHALEAAMLLDMLGLVGAYAIGSCRDQVSTLYVAGLAGAGLVYVFVHVSYFTLGLGDNDDDKKGNGDAGGEEEDYVENLGGRFLLFAVLVASMTYQAGLTPPGGFLLKDDAAQSGHHAGDPVLLYNYPRRYRAFFYCNSVSFMLSVVVILLLVNPNQYRPAIRSHALTVCSAASYVCLMGAFAAGCTQHLKGSYFILALAGLPSLSSAILLLLLQCCKGKKEEEKKKEAETTSEEKEKEKKEKEEEKKEKEKEEEEKKKEKEKEEEEKTNKSVYLVTLAILVASAAYSAGLDPPGGSWLSSSDGHVAGNPVMHDSRRHRYFAFFVGNTASFLASLMLILMLLLAMLLRRHDDDETPPTKDKQDPPSVRKLVNGGLVSLQCLGFLVAYAAGSSRQWKTSARIGTLLSAVLLFVLIHIFLSFYRKLTTTKTAKEIWHLFVAAVIRVRQDARSNGPRQLGHQTGAPEGAATSGNRTMAS